MKDYNYRPSGELQGDMKPMKDSNASRMGDFNKSLGDAKKSDLMKGYCPEGSITNDTKSDKGFA
ncbi:MAG: hypothetical protein ACU85E_16890 [Gammaproteobacteria bacterium]